MFLSLLLLTPAPLAEPWRSILLVFVLFAAIAIPLGLALWRAKDAARKRCLRIAYADRDALLYQVTKVLALVNYSQGPTEGNRVLFNPGSVQKVFGAVPIDLVFDQPGSARLTAVHAIMRRIGHNFRGAIEEKANEPSSLPWKGMGRTFVLLLGIMLVILAVGFFSAYRGNPSSPGGIATGGTRDLDVTQPLTVTSEQARLGANVEVKIEHTGQAFVAHVPAGSVEGTRIRFNGMGKFPPQGGPAGDLYFLLHIQNK